MEDNKENRTDFSTPKTSVNTQKYVAQRLIYGPLTERRNLHQRSNTLPDVVQSKAELSQRNGLVMSAKSQTRKQDESWSTPLEGLSKSKNDTRAVPATPCTNKVSPGLALLRNTPGVLKEKQQRLITQHEEIRQKGDRLKSGGGVSLWPDMVQMRLTQAEMLRLGVQACVLCAVAVWWLYKIHGSTFQRLHDVTAKVEKFCRSNCISERTNQSLFEAEVVNWHLGFSHMKGLVLEEFSVKEMSGPCQLYFFAYVIGFGMLLYYLLDNMLAHNKLTPSRIKKWTCLLTVIGTWTTVMGYGLLLAYQLERTLISCVQKYSSALEYLVISPLNLTTYQAVLLYWRSQLLDDATPGVVSVLGILPVRYLVQYLQFYSVPIITVIISPVLKLCWACVLVYRNGEYVNTGPSS